MKKIVSIRLAVIILICMVCSIGINCIWHIRSAYEHIRAETGSIFWQIEQLTINYGVTNTQSDEASSQRCISQAKAAARIIKNEPEIMSNKAALMDLVSMLQAKELHIFNPSGQLIAGTMSQYFGITFRSNKELADFLPMLQDRTLEVCSKVCSGIDGESSIKYAAVWHETLNYIICVGTYCAPTASEVSGYTSAFNLFGMSDGGSDLYAIDLENRKLLASTREGMEGRNLDELGCSPDSLSGSSGETRLTIEGEKFHGIYKEEGSVVLLRTVSENYIREEVINGCLLFATLSLLTSCATVAAVIHFLDKNIIHNISAINRELVQITQGDLDAELPKSGTPEFAEMCTHINEMVDSLMDMTHKMSLVFDETELPICVYELGPGMKRVLATNRLPEILHMTQDEVTKILSDSELFLQKLDEIEEYPLYPGSKIYRLPGMKNHYVRMEAFISDRYLMGVLVDETKSILERQLIERERDMDPLTDLYSRRAFFGRVQELMEDPGTLGYAVLMMADADGLKDVNDQHGHESGDRYLQAVADVLRSCRAKHHLVGRRSGDEFVLFIYGCSGVEEINNYLSMLLRQRDHVSVVLNDGVRIMVRFSVGMAYYPMDGKDFDTLLHLSDERMYQEKRARKAGR